MRRWLAVVPLLLVAACARGLADDSTGPSAEPSGSGDRSVTPPPGSDAGGGHDASSTPPPPPPGTGGDAAPPKDAAPPPDTGGPPPPPDSGGGNGGLDPDLGLPDPNGQPCSTPGIELGCPGLQICRISSPNGGRCEGCTTCNNRDQPCTRSSDCDILFQCYQGICTGICTLGTYECGPISDCIDVGNATIGVCRR